MAKQRSVALIMPALNEEDSVAFTLDSVFASTRLPDEIIVADGMSSDKTREIVMTYANRGVALRIIDNPKVFAGAGRNVAVQASSAEILLLVDFGNLLDKHWIEEIVRPFEEDESIDVVGGVFLPVTRDEFEFCVAAIHYPVNLQLANTPPEQRQALLPHKPDPGGLSIGVSRDLWQRMGGMPEWLRAAEDKIFGQKFMAHGAKTRFVPTATIYHHMRSTPQQLYHQLFVYWRGIGRTAHTRPYIVKLFGFYAVLILLLAGAPLVFLILLTAYLWRAGVHKISRANQQIPLSHRITLALKIVFPRDIGTLAGQIAGWFDWVFAPQFRRQLRTYLAAPHKQV